jgi:hypothetical protein
LFGLGNGPECKLAPPPSSHHPGGIIYDTSGFSKRQAIHQDIERKTDLDTALGVITVQLNICRMLRADHTETQVPPFWKGREPLDMPNHKPFTIAALVGYDV